MAVVAFRSQAGSFFATQATSASSPDLISAQVAPTDPQVDGLTPATDPALPDRVALDRVAHMDPTLYDLRDTSHLMRFIKALIGASGAGGVRKQATVARLGATLSGANFLDLDGFWGALFGLARNTSEALPEGLNPYTDAATPDTWDSVASSDGSYRSRIAQLARGFNSGATYFGVLAAAEAVLNIEVELIESWTLADAVPPGVVASAIDANTWLVVRSAYPTFGTMRGVSWGTLVGGVQSPGQTPLGNRGEVIVRPKRAITQQEKYQLGLVLDALKPSGVLITVLEDGVSTQRPVTAASYHSDSENWDVVSAVTERPGTVQPANDIYPGQSATQGARPALSQYSGESWTYNSRVAGVQSYSIAPGQAPAGGDYQTVVYLDGTSHSYVPSEGVMTAHQALAARMASDGVMTAYPYSVSR